MNLNQRPFNSSEELSNSSRSLGSTALEQPIEIKISPRKIARKLGWFVCFLICANTLGQLYQYLWAGGSTNAIVQLFFVDSENNLPSAYSSFALLLGGMLLGVIAIVKRQQNDRFARHWQILSLIFVYLAVDELASIHELAIEPLRHQLGASSVLYYTWIVPGAILVLIFALSYLRFLWALPRKIKRLFIQSGFIFILGALATELPEGWVEATYGQKSILFVFLVSFEETLEMLSIVVFLYALLTYIRSYIKNPIHFRVTGV